MRILKKVIRILICIIIILCLNQRNTYADSEFIRSSNRYYIIINAATNRLGYFKDKKIVIEFRVASGKTDKQAPNGKTQMVKKMLLYREYTRERS